MMNNTSTNIRTASESMSLVYPQGSVDVVTTAQKKDGKKKAKAIPIRKGARCYVC